MAANLIGYHSSQTEKGINKNPRKILNPRVAKAARNGNFVIDAVRSAA